eukprot:1188507-Prorocentrum_minimum.AAC.5
MAIPLLPVSSGAADASGTGKLPPRRDAANGGELAEDRQLEMLQRFIAANPGGAQQTPSRPPLDPHASGWFICRPVPPASVGASSRSRVTSALRRGSVFSIASHIGLEAWERLLDRSHIGLE